jgi:hypothetical protein
MLASETLARIENKFIEYHRISGKPSDMALYVRHESEGRLHCEVIIYLSPASSELAREIDARACEKPSMTGLGLLAGG